MSVIQKEDITKAIELVLRAAPGASVILFGSHARGEVRPDSDLDLLVIEEEVTARRQEMARLSDVLRPLGIPVDIVVVSRKTFEEWADTPGTLLYQAAKEGQVFDEVA